MRRLRLLKTCEQCKSSFNARRSIVRFCGTSCSSKWRATTYPLPSSCFKQGVPSWNKGLNLSGMKGKKHSKETKKKMRESSIGELASNWRGGISSENEKIRRSGQYYEWRKNVFERDNYTCQHCGTKSIAGNRVRLEADHIKPFASYPDLRFDINNGQTLCAPCHRLTPTWGKSNKATLEERHDRAA